MRWSTAFLLLCIPALGGCFSCEDRNWEPIQVNLTLTGNYADGEEIDISGDWGLISDPRDVIQPGLNSTTRDSGEFGMQGFTPNAGQEGRKWGYQILEMPDPFFLWDTPIGETFLQVGPDEDPWFATKLTLSNMKMRVEELRLDGRLWADVTVSGDFGEEGQATGSYEGELSLSYNCSGGNWFLTGFCSEFVSVDANNCTLPNPPQDCPLELAEVFYAEGAETVLENNQLSFGAAPLESCVLNIPHYADSWADDDGSNVDAGACLSDPQTHSADGCDWTVQAASYTRGKLNISARAEDGCSRDVTNCQYVVTCETTPQVNQ
jgi:hypothetical protein